MRPLSFVATALVASTIAAACGSSEDAATQSTSNGGSAAAGKAGAGGTNAAAGKAGTSGGGAGASGGAAGSSAGGGSAGSGAGLSGTGGTVAAGSAGASAGGASTGGTGGGGSAGTSAAGAGGTAGASSGGAGGGAGGSACPNPVVAPSVPDACAIDTDCVLGTALDECCGPVAYAVPTAQLPAWNAAAATYNTCKCPLKPACIADGTAAEDKTTPTTPNALAEPVARCRLGLCVATYESCKAFPDTPRACAGPDDCESLPVQPACCASEVRGISKSARAAYEKTIAAYGAACVDCSLVKCPIPAPTADDGTKATTADQKPSVSCQASLCTTSFGK